MYPALIAVGVLLLGAIDICFDIICSKEEE